jgi:iron complex outermembrane recepter protein
MRAVGTGQWFGALLVSAVSALVHAESDGKPTAAAKPMEEITVVGTTPLAGTGIDIDKLPANIQSVTVTDLARNGAASLLSAVDRRLGSVNFNDDLDDPFQPDIIYRGFEASPVRGTPQGLAVYQSGVRINEAFGDTVNWDLIPDIAIERIDVVGSNPVYGLNALGGAMVLTMKDGFSDQGGTLEGSAGSWGQLQGAVQYGVNDGRWGVYAAGRALEDDGWRKFSPDSLAQFYLDVAYREDRLAFDWSVTGADNALSGESPAPVQELAVHRSLVFTSPQENDNRVLFSALNASFAASDTLSMQGNAYYREFRQSVINGNTTNYISCTSASYAGSLCQADGATPLTSAAGALIPDLSQGGSIYIGENDFESTRTRGTGASLQVTSTALLFGHENHLASAISIDRDSTDFRSWSEMGTINAELQVAHSGQFVNTPQNTPWAATPVALHASNYYYGLLGSDTFSAGDALAVTISGRYNVADVDLADQLGTALTGKNHYQRFNPAAGVTHKFTSLVTGYLGYAEGNRVPTAGEIECSDPAKPCLLPSSLSSDPPTLRQVVARTWEAGLRGKSGSGDVHSWEINWNAGLFHTDVEDDIYGVATSLSSGYFQNIGGTRRQGVELGMHYQEPRCSVFLSYSYVAATFQSTLLLPSPQNSFADAQGNIHVHPGDYLPGIPTHRVKLGADLRITPSWLVGGDLQTVSPQHFGGDESNQMPALPGYTVLNMHSSYQFNERVQMYAHIVNLANRHYSTFGELGDPTGVGAPGIPPDADTNDPRVDNRFVSPAQPFSVYAGVRFRY